MKRFNWKSSQAMGLNLEVQKSSSRETYVKGKHIYIQHGKFIKMRSSSIGKQVQQWPAGSAHPMAYNLGLGSTMDDDEHVTWLRQKDKLWCIYTCTSTILHTYLYRLLIVVWVHSRQLSRIYLNYIHLSQDVCKIILFNQAKIAWTTQGLASFLF